MWKAVGPPLNLKEWPQSPHRRPTPQPPPPCHWQVGEDSEGGDAAAGC